MHPSALCCCPLLAFFVPPITRKSAPLHEDPFFCYGPVALCCPLFVHPLQPTYGQNGHIILAISGVHKAHCEDKSEVQKFVPSKVTNCPRNALKSPRIYVDWLQCGHILGYMAQNAMPRADRQITRNTKANPNCGARKNHSPQLRQTP